MKKVTLLGMILTCLLGLGLWQQQRFVAKAAPLFNTLTVINTNDSGPGSLREAVSTAASGDTIDFAVTGTISLSSGRIIIDKNLTIQGPGANLLTIQNTSWPSRVFVINNVAATLSGLTISGGNLSCNGIFADTCPPDPDGLNRLGGGIYNGGQLHLTSCTIAGNNSYSNETQEVNVYGDGIANIGTLWVSNSIIKNNNGTGTSPSSQGGGIYNSGTAYINNSTISENSEAVGAGILNVGSMTITNSTIKNNIAGVGGGIHQGGGSLTVTNSTISGNGSEGSNGGGINYTDGACTITNTTITGNEGFGGGIYNHQYSLNGIVPAGVFTISNSILAGNTNSSNGVGPDYYFPNDDSIPAAGYANLTSLGHNIFGKVNAPLNWTFTGPGDQVGSTASPINPLLGPLANNGGPTFTHALLAGSPAIDKGAAVAGLTTDQRGSPRPQDNPAIANASGGDGSDIGAYEVNCNMLVTTTADSGPGSLRQTIADACPNATITFDTDGVFATTQTILLTSGQLFFNKSLTIQGPGASQLTVSGNNVSRVFVILSGNTVALDGLTVSRGFSFGDDGGGIFNSGTLTVTNCTVNLNSALGFGSSGGGIYSSGTLTVTNCTVSNNSTSGLGAGIRNNGGTLTLTNCTVSGNSSNGNGGGGIYSSGGTVAITNSTITLNTTIGSGGGIFNVIGSLSVTNSTVTLNHSNSDNSGGTGGGIFAYGTETLNNTIVASNFRGTSTIPTNDIDGPIETANHNLIGNAATSGGITNGVNGNIVGNSGVGTLAINTVLNFTLANNGGPTKTHALVPNSPAIDAGSNALALDAANQPLTTDQRGAGFPRINGGTVDIGAYEFAASSIATTTTIDAQTITYNANGSVTVTVSSDSTTPTGSISLSVDGAAAVIKALTGGSATFTNTDIPGLASPNAGDHSLSAAYAAQDGFEASLATGNLHVNQATSSVTVTCPAVPQVFTGSAQTPCMASYTTSDGLSGSLSVIYTNNIYIGTAGSSAEYTGDANHLGSSGSGSFAISRAPTSITPDSKVDGTNDDCTNNTYTATLKDVNGVSLSGINLKMTIGTQATTATTDSNGVATFTLILFQAAGIVPQTFELNQTWTDPNRTAPPTASRNFTVLGDPGIGTGADADSLYTGSLFFWTASSSSSTATLTLSATLKDISDSCAAGDITKAKVSFLVSSNGGSSFSPVSNAQNLAVGLANPNDPTVGTASAISQYNIGSNQSVTLILRVVVGGYYSFSSSTYDVPVTIGKSGLLNSLMGGGKLKNDDYPYGASGYLGVNSIGSKFGSQVVYNKKGVSPQGQVTVTIRSCNNVDGSLDPNCNPADPSTHHVYWVKSNSISELSLISGSAMFGAKTNGYELLPDGTKVNFDSGNSMQLVFTPYNVTFPSGTFAPGYGSGTTATNRKCNNPGGCASIVLFRSSGGVWYSSSWGLPVGSTTPRTVLKNVLYGTVSVQ